MNKNSLLKGLTRNILALGIVSLFTDLSSEMIFPLIPLFITGVLGAGGMAVGIIEGSAETTASLFKVLSGYWSDKIKRRKPFVIFGYSMSAVSKPLFALAKVWPLILAVRIIERVGKGIRTAPRDAIVAESCDDYVRGKAYGFHRAMDTTGAFLGAFLAFLLLTILGHSILAYKKIFFLAFIPAIIGVLCIVFIKEKKVECNKIKSMSLKLSFRELPGNLKLFIIVSAVFSLGNFGYAFLLLKAKNIGLADNITILAYLLFNIVYAIFAMPFGMLSDKIGRKPILIGGYILFGIISFSLIFSSTPWSIFLIFSIYGIFSAMMEGVQRAFVVDLAPEHLKGTALGTFHTATGIIALPEVLLAECYGIKLARRRLLYMAVRWL